MRFQRFILEFLNIRTTSWLSGKILHFHSLQVFLSSNNPIYSNFQISQKISQKFIIPNHSQIPPIHHIVPMPANIPDPNNPNRRPYNPYYERQEIMPIQKPTPSEEPEVATTATETPPIQKIDSFLDETPPQ
jgi:hypothetical protein